MLVLIIAWNDAVFKRVSSPAKFPRIANLHVYAFHESGYVTFRGSTLLVNLKLNFFIYSNKCVGLISRFNWVYNVHADSDITDHILSQDLQTSLGHITPNVEWFSTGIFTLRHDYAAVYVWYFLEASK